MNLPKQPGGEVTRAELWEWVAMIAIIISWWPFLFFGFRHPLYLGLVYVIDPVVVIIIFIRRKRRLDEGLDYSKRLIDAQHQAREEAEKAERERRRKSRQ